MQTVIGWVPLFAFLLIISRPVQQSNLWVTVYLVDLLVEYPNRYPNAESSAGQNWSIRDPRLDPRFLTSFNLVTRIEWKLVRKLLHDRWTKIVHEWTKIVHSVHGRGQSGQKVDKNLAREHCILMLQQRF